MFLRRVVMFGFERLRNLGSWPVNASSTEGDKDISSRNCGQPPPPHFEILEIL
jgi:hypothetical protein